MADNSFKNTQLVANISTVAFMNELVLGAKIDRQLDEKNVFGSSSGIGGMNGATVKIRRPVYYQSTSGATLVEQGIEQAEVTVTLDIREHVAVAITEQDLTLKMDRFRPDIVEPAMEELAQKVESEIAAVYTEIANFTGTPGTTPSTFLDIGAPDQLLNELGVPVRNRFGFWTPQAKNALANGLKMVFVQSIAKRAIEEAAFGRYLTFDNFMCQSLKSHTVGALGGTPLVDGATQDTTYLLAKDTDTSILNVKGWSNSITDIVKAGDVITLAGVNAVNRKTREDTGQLATFTIINDATSTAGGLTALTIAPAMIISGPYRTVTVAPADNAVVTIKTGAANSVHPQNLTWHKNALTMASAQLHVPTEGAVGSRAKFKGISIRVVRQYDIISDKLFVRFDILFKIVVQNRGFACRVTS